MKAASRSRISFVILMGAMVIAAAGAGAGTETDSTVTQRVAFATQDDLKDPGNCMVRNDGPTPVRPGVWSYTMRNKCARTIVARFRNPTGPWEAVPAYKGIYQEFSISSTNWWIEVAG